MGAALSPSSAGAAGIAWTIGMPFGLEQGGISVRRADTLIGTSTGAVIAAQIAGGTSLYTLYQRQLDGIPREMPGRVRPEDVVMIDRLRAVRKRPRRKLATELWDAWPAPGQVASAKGAAR